MLLTYINLEMRRVVKQKAKETIHLSLVDKNFPTAIEAKKTETTTHLY